MPSIKKVEKEGNVVKIQISGTNSTFMNAIRRVVMQDVPCFAIEDISIYENDSVMFDEFVGHRLGMLPIKSNAKGYKVGDSVKMVLEKEGPCEVFSKDIKSTDPKVEVSDKNIPLTKLGKNQRIKLEMKAVMQSGKEHAKWQPAVISYQQDEKDEGNFTLIVESSGSLTAKEILDKAIKVLQGKTKQFEKETKKIK